jgi:2-dehydropantoate 2-reductase
VQNGMTADVVADVVGPERTMGCVIEISSMMFEPGVIERHSPPSVVDDIRATKWMKLVSNCCTLVPTAALGLSMVDAGAIPEMRELMLRAGQEALETGVALGHPILPIFGLTPADVDRADRVVEALLDVLFAGFVLPHTTTTVLHDWRKGRHSEVDDVNGLVVAEQTRLGGVAPVNAAWVRIAHRIERGELEPAPANLTPARELADTGVGVQ